MLSPGQAFFYSVVMGIVIFLCRLFPFLFFGSKKRKEAGKDSSQNPGFLAFVEKIIPPVAMTVLAFNSLVSPLKSDPANFPPGLIAALVCAAAHLWKRNALFSIAGGTAVYMVLIRVF